MGENASREHHQKLYSSLVRFERCVQKGVDRIITPQIDFVSKKTMQGYDAITRSLLKGDAKKTALRVRPTVVRVAKGMGVSLVVAEGVALVIGAKKGADWLTKRFKHRKQIDRASSSVKDAVTTVLDVHESPLVTLDSRRIIRTEPKLAPEVEAHNVLLEEIRVLQETGKVSDQLERLLFMTANNIGTTDHGKISFKQSAKASLEHICGSDEGREALQRIKYAMEADANSYRIEDYMNQLIHHVGDNPHVDHVSLNWWAWAYRAIGIRELLGISPEKRIYGVDYGSQWVTTPPPYLEFVLGVVKKCQPGPNDWVFHGSSK